MNLLASWVHPGDSPENFKMSAALQLAKPALSAAFARAVRKRKRTNFRWPSIGI